MKTTLLLLLLSSSTWAACPLFTFGENHKLDQEINNICDNILNPTINYETVTKESVTSLAVSTITAVSSATITNLTVTGTLNAWPFQAPIQATSVTGTSTTSSTFQATQLTATITPISASHRIKITVCGDIRSANSVTSNAIITIKRGATDLGPASALGGFAIVSGAGGNLYNDTGIIYIDSPATTSATTYTVYLKNGDNATTVKFGELTAQVMTLEEIL